MPRLTLETSHALGQEEALRRVKEKAGQIKQNYQSQVGELREEWNGGRLSFGFQAVGMKFGGTLTVEDSEVKLTADLPLAAMMFKGRIVGQLRRELSNLLA